MHPMMVKRELAELRSRLAGLNANAGYRFNDIVQSLDTAVRELASDETKSLEIQAEYLSRFPNECSRQGCWNHHNFKEGSRCEACMQETIDGNC